jgi:hypothetical protein
MNCAVFLFAPSFGLLEEIEASQVFGSYLLTLQKYNVKNVDVFFIILVISPSKLALSAPACGQHLQTYENSTLVYPQSSRTAPAHRKCRHLNVRSGRYGVRRGETVRPSIGLIARSASQHK